MWWWWLWCESGCVGRVYSFCKGGSCKKCNRAIVKAVLGLVVCGGGVMLMMVVVSGVVVGVVVVVIEVVGA